MRLLYQFPTWLQRLYKGVTWRIEPQRKAVYLTFDDGPIPEVTPAVLDILKEYDVHATFFMVAENAAKNPEIYLRVDNEGHTIGNHTFNHIKGTRTRTEEYMENVDLADATLGATRLFRPPYGRLCPAQKKALLKDGYAIYLWDVLTHDYNPRYSPERMLRIIQQYTRNGSIINFHDSLRSADRMLTVLPQAIEWLLQQGYEVLPIPQK